MICKGRIGGLRPSTIIGPNSCDARVLGENANLTNEPNVNLYGMCGLATDMRNLTNEPNVNLYGMCGLAMDMRNLTNELSWHRGGTGRVKTWGCTGLRFIRIPLMKASGVRRGDPRTTNASSCRVRQRLRSSGHKFEGHAATIAFLVSSYLIRRFNGRRDSHGPH